MNARTKNYLRVGKVALLLKTLILGLVFLAVYCDGLSHLQTLWLGTEVLPMNQTIREQFGVNSRGGVLIDRIIDHSPAEDSGLLRGDVILNVDNRPIYTGDDIRNVLRDREYKDSIRIVYLRDDVIFAAKVLLDYRAVNAVSGNAKSLYLYRPSLKDIFALMVLGLLAGSLSGMLGCGGGVLKVSLLITFFGFEIFLAKVVSLVSCGFMSLSSSYRYVKLRLVDRESLKYLIPSALVGVACGAGLSVLLSRHVLEIILGLFLLYAACDMLYEIYVSMKKDAPEAADSDGACAAGKRPGLLLAVGFPLGLCSAVLGITGGVVGTPLQRYLTKAPIKTCIANTLVTVVFVSFLGGTVLLAEGLVRDYFSFKTFLHVLVPMALGSIVGGQFGAILNKELPVNVVKGIYAALVLFISYRILILG